MGELPVVPKCLLVAVAALLLAALASLKVARLVAVAPAAAPVVRALMEKMGRGRGTLCGLGHLHLYRVEDTVDVDVLDVGWLGLFGETFGNLDFICKRQESKEFRIRNTWSQFQGVQCVTLLSSILTFLIHPTDHLVYGILEPVPHLEVVGRWE